MKKDPVIEKVLELSRDMAEVKTELSTKATKSDLNEVKTLVEKVLVTVERIDNDRKVQAVSITRLDDRDEAQQVEIEGIKEHAGMR